MDHYLDVLVLLPGGEWLQRVVIPLVESRLQFEHAQLVNGVGKGPQLLVANFVEPHVLLKLFKSALATNFLEHGEMLEDDLGSDQLCLPVILLVHISALAADVSHTVIVGDRQLLEVLQELVPLRLQTLDMRLHIDVLVINCQVLSVEHLNLIVRLVELLEYLHSFSREVVHLAEFQVQISA